jgi:hypothetical protein
MIQAKITFTICLLLVLSAFRATGQDTTPPVIECPGSQNQGISASCLLSPTFASCYDNLCINDVEIFNSSGELIMSNTGTGCSGPNGFIFYPPLEGQTTASLIPGESYTIRVAAPDSVDLSFHVRLNTIGAAGTEQNLFDPVNFMNEFEATFEIPVNASQRSIFLRVIGMPFQVDWACTGISGFAEVEQYVLLIDRGYPRNYCNIMPDYTPLLVVNDDTDPNPVISQLPAPGSTIPINGGLVEIIATDLAGNSSSFEFMVYPSDLNFPTITCPESITILSQELDSVWVEIPTPVVSDNCGDVLLVNDYNDTENASDYFYDGYQEIMFIATDAFGNRSECSMSVSIPSLDTIAPEIICPIMADTNVTVLAPQCTPIFNSGCSDDAVHDVIIRDSHNAVIMSHLRTQCSGDFNAYNQFALEDGITTCTLFFGHHYNISVDMYVFNEFFSAFIDYNNDGQFNQDEERIFYSVNSGLYENAQFTLPSDNILPGLHRMRVIANFGSNTSSCVNATWGETHDYLINLQPSWPASFCDVLPDFSTHALVTDNDDLNPSVIQTPAAGTIIQDSVVVTLVATDFANNTSSCSFTVYPYDATPPTIQCQDTLMVDEIDSDSLWVEVPLPVHYDNCSETSLMNDYTNDESASGYYYHGTTDVIFSATDQADNLSTCQTTVILIPVNPACLYDLNSDGNVDVADLIILLDHFGCTENCEVDFSGDGVTGSADIMLFMGYVGLFCD